MITALIIFGAIILAIIVAHGYKTPGAVGMAGVMIAGFLVREEATAWRQFILLLAIMLFVIGMFFAYRYRNKPNTSRKDVFLHPGALLINALSLLPIGAIFGWNGWTDTSSVPTAFFVPSLFAFLYVTWRIMRYTYKRADQSLKSKSNQSHDDVGVDALMSPAPTYT